MKRPLIIGNWKSHKVLEDMDSWFAEVGSSLLPHPMDGEVVLCPPYPLLATCKELINKHQLPWKLGAQDVSSLPEGKYTGEVNAKLLKDFVDYVLIGHSERRNELHETDEMLFEKIKRVKEVGLTPVLFVQGQETKIPDDIEIIGYEPVFAIGTGNPDTPEDAEKVANYFKTVKHVPTVLYGGSVDSTNIHTFLSCPSLDGVVPGTASLDPKAFSALINNA